MSEEPIEEYQADHDPTNGRPVHANLVIARATAALAGSIGSVQ